MQRQFFLLSMRAIAWTWLVILMVHVPRAPSATIRQLVEVVDIGNLSISPDGRLVAFRTEQASIERNTYETIWFVQPVDGSARPRRLGEGGETLRDTGGYARREPARWSPDGRWIYYRVAMNGRIDLWRAATDGSRTEQLTHDLANIRDFSLSADGTVIRYGVGATREAVVAAEQAEYDGGIHIDGTVPMADSLFRSGYHEGRLATQRQAKDGEYFPLLSGQPDRWKEMNISTGITTEPAAERHPDVPLTVSDLRIPGKEVDQLAQEPRGSRVAVLVHPGEEAGSSTPASVELGVLATSKDRRPVMCPNEACVGKAITDITWRPGSDEVLFTVTARDQGLGQSIFRWNVVSGTVKTIVQSSGELSGGNRLEPGPCSASSAAIVCVSASADRPPRLECIDPETGTRTVLFEPNQALAQDMQEAPKVRLVSWVDSQGTRYTGQFYPAIGTDGRLPALFVSYYRCAGFLRGGLGDEWPLAVLARNGIAALCINSAPHVDDAVVRYDQGIAAIAQVVKALGERGEVDPSRVGLGGLSFGAEVSMWAAMYSDIPRAISMSTPVATPALNVFMGLWDGDNAARMRRFWQLGTPAQTPDRWRQLSPAYAPERVKVPVLMQMSEQEYRVALEYAVPMIRDRQADVYVFPNEPHQKFQPRHKLAVYQRNLDWFRFWLLGAEDEDPTKVGQYAVWRRMRDERPGARAR